jgi:hypothetical protein
VPVCGLCGDEFHKRSNGTGNRRSNQNGPLALISRISSSTLSWWFAYNPSSRDGPSGCCIVYHKLSRRLFIFPVSR